MTEPNHQLAALQLAIMRVLWERGEATVADVREDLHDERPLAYTTIATMLAKMERKGYVAHRIEGRAHIYRPAIDQEKVSRSMVTDLADRLFAGDVTQMVAHLLDGCDVDADELARLKALIRAREKEDRDAR
ncbi:BlaI/MecI/CopY family transcriptional regulator [Symmachiella dynata]|uniref:BlaI/MecI/CopY family transcriptional regulator n=1 Tax=Symmachiella dynata TaxID=2527995 RepID=UPI00118BDD21|nr:BlaI/MecI/CopY family transcriptional regulator [Symmachiella dynata]QDT46408.1 Penicillinase repressor [Symmachiella dynata]|tara:strand:- start:209 stop:604 length:396 start_codon:yes stop_codon:yes gene_type:complete